MLRAATVATVVAVSLTLLALGCDGTEPTNEESEPAAVEESGDATPFDLESLNGTWDVTTELTHIDNEQMSAEADLPGTEWECVVDGSKMTLSIDPMLYEGDVGTSGADSWEFYGGSQYLDEAGATWTSWILVQATQADADSFTGTIQGGMATSTEGNLYIAEWNVEGTRQ